MAKADGKVVISTALDNKGLEKGINNVSGKLGGLKSVVGKLGAAVAAAFAVQKIVQFGAQCIELGSDVAEVQNVVDTAFGSMSYKMESFADSAITQFGMSKLAAKKTGSTYMAMAKGMGLSAQAASDMAVSLTGLTGDVASFYNIDQESAATKLKSVFTGETEALKDLGVVMTQTNLQQFALSQGISKNIADMTQAEQVALRYKFVTDALSLASGDFAKTQDGWANQTRILSMQWQEFMSVIGQALTTVLLPVVRFLNTIVAALIKMANTFNAVISSIFGGAAKQIKDTGAAAAQANAALGSSAGAAAEGEDNLADSAKKAGKAASGASSSIDELNVIQQDTGSGAETAAGGGSTGSAGGIEVVGQEEVQDQLSPQIQKIVDKVQQLLEPLRNINFEPLAAAFGRLKEAVEPLGKALFAGLEWAYYNIFVPLAAWTIQDLLPAFLDLLAAACDVLSAAVEALKPLAKWLWDKFLKPIAAWTGGKIVDTLHVLTDALTGVSGWISENQGLVQTMTITAAAFMAVWKGTEIGAWIINAGGLAGIIGKVTKAIKDGTIAKIADKAEDMQIIALYVGDFVKALASTIASIASRTAAWIGETAAKVASTAAEWAHVAATTAWNAVAAIGEAVTWAFGAAVAFLTSPIGLVILAIGALIAIVVLLVKNWDTVKATALAVWDGIKAVWGKVCGWFTTTVIDPLTKAWDTFKTGFLELWDGIVQGIKGAINGIIGFINGMINAVVDGINWIINAINTLSWDIPDLPIFGDLAGQTIGFNITPITAPQIPKLAQGAVLPANKPFLAMVGDQSRGTNVEAPLETIKQAVAEVMAKMGGTQKFTADQPIEVSLDGEVIYRALARIAASRGVGIGGAFANAY